MLRKHVADSVLFARDTFVDSDLFARYTSPLMSSAVAGFMAFALIGQIPVDGINIFRIDVAF